jgi:hypothetical protein
MDLLQWWNLIFILPAVAALLYLLLLSLGVAPIEGHGADVEVHLDPGVELDINDVHADAHPGDLPGNITSDTDPMRSALSLIGIGRIPLSLVLMSFLFLWGFFGWVANQVLSGVIASPALYIWPSLAVALIGAGAFTRVIAMRLGRLMPATESYGAGAREFVGRIADVRYALTESSGAVQLIDTFGSMLEVPARVMPGESVIPAGERVVLWRYDVGEGAYFAVQDDAIEVVGSQRGEFPIR